MTLGVHDRFPAATVTTVARPVALRDLWTRGPLVVAFHRLWCPFCQQAGLDLSRLAPRLYAMGGQVVIAYRESLDAVTSTCIERHTQAVCVSDADRRLERAVDLRRRGSVRRATFVVDTQGRVAYVHRAATLADIPPIHDLSGAIDGAAMPVR